MYRWFGLVLIFLISLSILSAQTLPKGTVVVIDHLENQYYLSENVFKNVTSSPNIEYQNSFYGKIFSVDVSNPLRILIFYKDANTIIILNNELSEIAAPIHLDDLDLVEVSAVCSSTINGFWAFNGMKSRLEFYDDNLKLVHSSYEQISQIEDSKKVLSMQMAGKYIYLNVEDLGLMVFDMFANYIKTLPVRNINSFQVLNEGVIYAQDEKILYYDSKRLQVDTILESQSHVGYVRVFNKTVYYQVEDSLLIEK